MTDSDRPLFRLFQKPEEPPPGLEAIRAWLRKPRPRLAHALSWIPYLLSGIPEAWKFAKKNYGPATVQLKRIAARAAPAARALARFGPVAAAAARLARMVDRSVRAGQVFVTRCRAAMSAFRDPHTSPAQPERPGEIEAPGPGGRPTEAETGPAAAPSGVPWLGGLFRPDPPPGLNLPREPAATPEAAPPSKPRQLPPSEPETVSGGKPEETPARPASPGDKPEDDPPRPAAPAGGPAERSPRETPPSPATATPPGPTRDPDARTSPPPSPAAASPAPEIDWERRLKGLPKVLRPHVKGLSQRPGRDILQPLIFDICRLRKWTTAGELARWLSMHQGMLVHRHLRPMLEAGVLKLKYPDRPNSRHQAYRARRREAAQAD